ncbi:hypothetical protein JL720_10507 [Aureococcus anophagefferens]|nr:hypothetical protein JL720_10507 [Aureococcus anophagefferens]
MNAAKLSLEGGPAKRVDAKAEAVLAAAAGEGPEPRATLARLLHEGVSPGVSDEYGRQPLHHAAFGDALDAARILYDCGADVDAADGGGNRPLHVAAARGSGAVLDFLLGCAAVVDASNHDGDRPLHLAAWMGHGGCAARLLAGDANVDAINSFGHDPLENIIERSPAVAKQKARLLAGKRQKPLPPQLQACMDLLIAAQAEKRGGAVDAAAGFA